MVRIAHRQRSLSIIKWKRKKPKPTIGFSFSTNKQTSNSLLLFVAHFRKAQNGRCFVLFVSLANYIYTHLNLFWSVTSPKDLWITQQIKNKGKQNKWMVWVFTGQHGSSHKNHLCVVCPFLSFASYRFLRSMFYFQFSFGQLYCACLCVCTSALFHFIVLSCYEPTKNFYGTNINNKFLCMLRRSKHIWM